MRTLIKHVWPGRTRAVTVKGCLHGATRKASFLELNDGRVSPAFVVVDVGTPGRNPRTSRLARRRWLAGCAVTTPGQKWECAPPNRTAGRADANYPLQKKGHTLEFLRTIAHLRPRSNLFGAMFRARSKLAFAVHEFFQSRDFVYVHTPIITASDCEGAGEMFRVTTLKGKPDEKPETDFFAVRGSIAARSCWHRITIIA
jgi:asparaginyl-tRNA synthetase